MKQIKLKNKFLFLLVFLLIVAFVANTLWSKSNQRAQMEAELHTNAVSLAQQMDAVWEFMSTNQDRLDLIALDKNGRYQGLHCAIAGNSISLLFNEKSNYIIRFINFDPRNERGTPDEYEEVGLNSFLEDSTVEEYASFSRYQDNEVYRYMAPMVIESTCLDCHGDPEGDIDISGYAKEGLSVGDIGGAISIIIPLDIYEKGAINALIQNAIFFFILLLIIILVVYFGLTILVTLPLKKIHAGIGQVQEGALDTTISAASSSIEIDSLTLAFNEMTNELDALYSKLESKVVLRTAELAEANKQLKKRQLLLKAANEQLKNENTYKSDFLASVSHDLRTPLTSIIAYVALLRDTSNQLSERDREAYNEIDRNGRILLMMIDSILEMSKIQAGRSEMNVEILDIGEIAEFAYSTVRPIMIGKGIDFDYQIESSVPLVEGDFDKLRQVFENLLSNAAKFTKEGGKVELVVEYYPSEEKVGIVVKDTGVGISEDRQKEIFKKFVQADQSISRIYGGAGIGLALVKEIVDMHKGSIELFSEVDKGSIFTVKIPASMNE